MPCIHQGKNNGMAPPQEKELLAVGCAHNLQELN